MVKKKKKTYLPLRSSRRLPKNNGRALFPGEGTPVSEDTAAVVDQEVTRLVNEAHERARSVLKGQRTMLDRLAELLMVTEVIDGKDLTAYVDGTQSIPEPEPGETGASRAPSAQGGNGGSPARPDRAGSGPDIVVRER